MADFRDLIERVEKLDGPRREVDYLIWAEMDGRDVREHDGTLVAKSRRPPHDECVLGFLNLGRRTRWFIERSGIPPCPHYTSSLDAATALCERDLPGWSFMLDNRWRPSAKLLPPGQISSVEARTVGPSLAIALVLAVLRALAKEGQT